MPTFTALAVANLDRRDTDLVVLVRGPSFRAGNVARPSFSGVIVSLRAHTYGVRVLSEQQMALPRNSVKNDPGPEHESFST